MPFRQAQGPERSRRAGNRAQLRCVAFRQLVRSSLQSYALSGAVADLCLVRPEDPMTTQNLGNPRRFTSTWTFFSCRFQVTPANHLGAKPSLGSPRGIFADR